MLLRNISLRFRYIISMLIMLIPILIFSIIIYTSSQERNVQYINNATWQNFLYATENVSSLIERLDYVSQTAFGLENAISLSEDGSIDISSDAMLCAALSVLEERISPKVTILYLVRGDKYIYSSAGKILYSDYEREYLASYNLSLSRLYSRLQKLSDPTLIPILSRENREIMNGFAYALPFPKATVSKGTLAFILSDEVIINELETYLGSTEYYDVYLYDSFLNLLFETSGQHTSMSADKALKVQGMGIHEVTEKQQKLMLLRTVTSDYGLHWVLISQKENFYSSMAKTSQLMLFLIFALILIMLVFIICLAYYNYKPIFELIQHISGGFVINKHENELKLIRSYYEKNHRRSRKTFITIS